MKFGMFFVGEYLGITLISAMTTTLFFGGWLGFSFLPPVVWFLLKMFAFILVFILLRASLPRPRYDQLMSFGWKILLRSEERRVGKECRYREAIYIGEYMEQ